MSSSSPAEQGVLDCAEVDPIVTERFGALSLASNTERRKAHVRSLIEEDIATQSGGKGSALPLLLPPPQCPVEVFLPLPNRANVIKALVQDVGDGDLVKKYQKMKELLKSIPADATKDERVLLEDQNHSMAHALVTFGAFPAIAAGLGKKASEVVQTGALSLLCDLINGSRCSYIADAFLYDGSGVYDAILELLEGSGTSLATKAICLTVFEELNETREEFDEESYTCITLEPLMDGIQVVLAREEEDRMAVQNFLSTATLAVATLCAETYDKPVPILASKLAGVMTAVTNWLKADEKRTDLGKLTLKNIFKAIKRILRNADENNYEEAIQAFIDFGCVPKIVEFINLNMTDFKVIRDAFPVLGHIAGGSDRQTSVVVESQAVESLIAFMKTFLEIEEPTGEHLKVCRDAVFGLSNIAAGSTEHVKKVLEAMPDLVQLMRLGNFNVNAEGLATVLNLLSLRDHKVFEIVMSYDVLPLLCQFLCPDATTSSLSMVFECLGIIFEMKLGESNCSQDKWNELVEQLRDCGGIDRIERLRRSGCSKTVQFCTFYLNYGNILKRYTEPENTKGLESLPSPATSIVLKTEP